jgi:Ca2+-binding RTX toxin-like protein
MERLRSRSVLGTFAVMATVGAMVVADSRAEPAPDVAGVAARGALSISNSKEGRAILRGTAMRPGESVSGTVTIADTGDGPGLFELSASNLVDTPGAGAGVLSERLRLVVEDLSNAAGAARVYDGSLAALSIVPLGELRAGERRTYRLTMTFGVGDGVGATNAYQRATSTAEFDWTARRIDTSGPCANRIFGSAGPETVTGSSAGDRISAGAGDDHVRGLKGSDCLDGEAGDDVVDARDGEADSVDCGPGRDTALVDAVDRTIDCETTVPGSGVVAG